MLKFFRLIRRKLLAEGSFRKYLVYATGEILLVVIGILIALQINNWNETKKALAKEEIILKDLAKDLESNTVILQNSIKTHQQRISEIAFIVDHFEQRLPYSDSLAVYLPRMAWTNQLTLLFSAFESLKSSGFDIINSHGLKIQIIELFGEDYHSTSQWINSLSLEKHKEFRAVFTGFPRGGISDNYEIVLANDQLYYLLTTFQGWKEEVINRESILLERTKKLKGLISGELH